MRPAGMVRPPRNPLGATRAAGFFRIFQKFGPRTGLFPEILPIRNTGVDRPLTQNPIFCQGQCQAGSTRGPLKSAGARLSEKRTRENRPRFGHFSLDFRQTDMDREVNRSFLMTGRFFSPFTAPTLDDGG